MSIVQWPHAVSTQWGKCMCLCNILILPTWIRVSITLMLAQYVITKMLWRWNIDIMDYEINKMSYLLLLSLCIKSVKMKSVFEKYLSNTPKYANQIQIQIQIFHLVVFQIQIQIQIFAYLNTNTNTNTYLTPALTEPDWAMFNFTLVSMLWNTGHILTVLTTRACVVWSTGSRSYRPEVPHKAYHKTATTPLLMHWSYHSIVLNCRMNCVHN